MNQPNAFATFREHRGVVYRTSTYLQWGPNSEGHHSLGSCLLLNPGSAKLFRERPASGHSMMGQTTLDPTMRQLIRLVEAIYGQRALVGRFHIYNLFSVQNAAAVNAISHFEQLIHEKETTLESQLVSTQELQKHPWLLLGWGLSHHHSWQHFSSLKKLWKQRIATAGVPTFGKPCPKRIDYYHPSPPLHASKEMIVEELVEIYRKTIGRKSAHPL
ncbi:hypothetical protein P4V43_21465 [Brevibacillus fortis]|uniref:hypothetical protein n=1 Tax=Brevibacillus fortis TaxID=2126352 RepID=UPI002E1ECB1F|nr:hypothetical protein [Brevibacillus fortis]